MPDSQRKLICISWAWWREAQVNVDQNLWITSHFVKLYLDNKLHIFLLQHVSVLLWSWIPATQKSLLCSPSPSAGRESALDTQMTIFEYEPFFFSFMSFCCSPSWLQSASKQPHLPLCPCPLGHWERGQCVQKWASGTSSGIPAPDQSDLTPVRLPGRLPGDGGARRWSRGAARVSQRKDVFAHRQVTNI